MPELTELNENAVIAWIQNTAEHGQTVGIVPRNYKAIKFDENGDIDPLHLPAVIVQAVQGQQLHTQIAVWRFDLEATLIMQADDSNQDAWDGASISLEKIFTVAGLEAYLTNSVTGYLCRGIVHRNYGQTTIEERHWKRHFKLQMWASRDS